MFERPKSEGALDFMIEARPSGTAMKTAVRRAAHQLLDRPVVFEDPIAVRILNLGTGKERILSFASKFKAYETRMRALVSVRSRYAEDCLARAIVRGTAQFVVLGAGLDTFAYRNPYAEDQLRVFEVDFPATQEWKRRQLAQARITIPPTVTYVPMDFEHQTLAEALRLAGFDGTQPAFFSWLGVTMYLTEETILSTLRFIATLPPGGGVALDYAATLESLSPGANAVLTTIVRRTRLSGEPFLSHFDAEYLAAKLRAIGFHDIESLGHREINARYFQGRSDDLRVGELCRLMSAEV